MTLHIDGNEILDILQKSLHEPLNHLGFLWMYNGLNIKQGKHVMKFSCETYLQKILTGHGWEKETSWPPIRTPINNTNAFIR